MERAAGVVCLGRMAAVESLACNLDREDSEAKRWGKQFESIDGPCGDGDQKEDDAMRIMAAGDVDVTVYQNGSPPEPTPPEPPPEPTPPEIEVIRDDQTSITKTSAGTFAKLAIGGALLASGLGVGSVVGLTVPWLLGAFDRPDPPAASTGYEYLGRVFEPEPGD